MSNVATDVLRSAADLVQLRDALRKARHAAKPRLRVCITGCRAFGALEVLDRFREVLREMGREDELDVLGTGCHGFCAAAPVIEVDPTNTFYHGVSPEDVPEIIEATLKDEIVERLLFTPEGADEPVHKAACVPFYAKQRKIVLRNCGQIDPTHIEDYIEREGYAALAKVLGELTPQQVIDEVKASGLRGRGGAGFPTGMKWQFVADAQGDRKFLICNADEGDPGAFMDRAVLEGDPHSVLEGMLIAAYATGAREGYIYVRAEYPIAIDHLRRAVEQAEQLGLLGESILGTDLSFEAHVKEGAGAFVCGEETALIASIEGRRGTPRPRPPFPAQSGLLGCPTNINNVETFANIPPLVLNGAGWFARYGTEKSKGTKIFSLAGKVAHTGLVEVPIGTPVREVVYDIGGGPPGGRQFKAAQMGGPSGGCVPASHLDLPIDYESLQSIGAIMGSGGLVVMDDQTCMVDVARFFLRFVQSESCGKCVPCRIGTRRMLDTLEAFSRGEGTMEDVDELADLARKVKQASLCGLGQTAPNPVLSTIAHFRDEYEAHIVQKRCPAGVCKALLSYRIDPEKCVGCMACAKACPVNAITGEKKQPHVIDPALCIKCGQCLEKCKFEAVLKG
jgi:NADH:ubiquinone oxidoreductase subunit F (NADH-binding)/(2Fe-2S) ferredoxin